MPTSTPTLTTTATVTPTSGTIQDPELSINFATGSPGSIFVVRGINFSANTTATIRINGTIIIVDATIDGDGTITVILDTSNADPGRYTVTISTGAQLAQATAASIGFELSDDAPMREREADVDGVEVMVPAGIAQSGDERAVYLPIIGN
jgi:hypothetical protein